MISVWLISVNLNLRFHTDVDSLTGGRRVE
jgi:hypothetical protein